MPKRLILKDFELTEISGVDRPAQPTATMAIIKRRESDPLDELKVFCNESIEKALTFASAEADSAIDRTVWRSVDLLQNVVWSIVGNDDLDPVAKRELISVSVDQFSAKIKNELNEESSEALTKFITDLAKGNVESKEGKKMADPNPNVELDALKKQVADLTAANADYQALAKLDDKEKQFMGTMDDEAKKAFAGLTAEERKAKMDLAKNSDEILEVNGTTISKAAVGAALFEVMKAQQAQLDAQKLDVAKAQEHAVIVELKKRVSDEFNAIPGTPDELAAVLKTFAVMPEAVRNTAEAVFKSAQALAVKAGVTQGHSFGKGESGEGPLEQLTTLAKAYADKNNMDYNKAYAVVIEQNADLYEQALKEGQ